MPSRACCTYQQPGNMDLQKVFMSKADTVDAINIINSDNFNTTTSAQRLISTGSLTGYHVLSSSSISAISHYLTSLPASSTKRQSFCGNAEGWGPLSPTRYDFTPCFMDVWISTVAVFGIIGGAVAVAYLWRKKAQEVGRNWHFWTKQVCIPILLIICLRMSSG